MLTRIKSGNIQDGEIRVQDIATGSVTIDKLDFQSGGSPGDVLTTDGIGNLFFTAVGGVPIALDSLTDIDITTNPPLIGDSLTFDGSAWVPKSFSGNIPFALNNLTDVTFTFPLVQNEFLRFDGFGWINDKVSVVMVEGIAEVAITGLINSLADVNVTGVTIGQRLGFDGSQWRAVDAADFGTIDNFSDVDTTTVPPVNGNALIFDGGDSIWKPVATGLGNSSNTFIVQNIAARNALSPAEGDQAFVRDGGTIGEWELYLFDSVWILVATQDSAATDARTIAGDINPSTISPVLLGNVSAGSRVTLVTIEVTTAFDGAPVLTVGTDAINNELASNAEIDLNVIGTYTIVTDVEYLATPDTDIKAFFAVGGATVGDARILVTYV